MAILPPAARRELMTMIDSYKIGSTFDMPIIR